ncbi:MAG: DUF2160 family membrane protein [Chloroflexota bacterium]|nr:DUF2160 family membrane protein [Chloroflexota bacterium]MXX50927.1 hypothetical protein [Chloroflexota bacterium]MYA93706.1 hypothetical protein [Chloroflexota bacterium]MYD38266.1 hypothetical protein [Chloroflexota bacterium]MYE78459.1 hypothetical protein [Chloroflexota bacterium]
MANLPPSDPPYQREEEVGARQRLARSDKEPGFLPIYTNAFDRVFISLVILIGIHLLWLRFMEPALPIEVATVISLAIGIYIVRRG